MVFSNGDCSPLESDLAQQFLKHCLITAQFQFKDDAFAGFLACLSDAVSLFCHLAVITGLEVQVIIVCSEGDAVGVGVPGANGILGIFSQNCFCLGVSFGEDGFQFVQNGVTLLAAGFPQGINFGLCLIVQGAERIYSSILLVTLIVIPLSFIFFIYLLGSSLPLPCDYSIALLG